MIEEKKVESPKKEEEATEKKKFVLDLRNGDQVTRFCNLQTQVHINYLEQIITQTFQIGKFELTLDAVKARIELISYLLRKYGQTDSEKA